MARPRLPLDERAVLEAYAAGESLPAIALRMSVDRSRVTRVVKDAGVHVDQRGVTARGEQSGTARLTEAHVRQLRNDREHGMTYAELAHAYAITEAHVWRILTRRVWSHVA